MPREYHPREWPYLAKAARDCAAEEIAAALRHADDLSASELDAKDLRHLTKIIYHTQNALRHLESAGARTRPPEP